MDIVAGAAVQVEFSVLALDTAVRADAGQVAVGLAVEIADTLPVLDKDKWVLFAVHTAADEDIVVFVATVAGHMVAVHRADCMAVRTAADIAAVGAVHRLVQTVARILAHVLDQTAVQVIADKRLVEYIVA